MNVRVSRVLVAAATFFVQSAQTPSPAPSAAAITITPLSKVRHLEYSFEVSYPGGGVVANRAANAAMALQTPPELIAAGGATGNIGVDVVALTSDGGVVAKISETRKGIHAGEAFTCVVYGDGRTQCNADGPLSDTENVLLSYLGRNFFDQSRLDQHNHWQHAYKGKEVAVTTDYTVRDGERAPLVDILQHSDIVSLVNARNDTTVDAKIIYDTALSVPDSIHSVAVEGAGPGTRIDLTLSQDSFSSH